jgi:Family of unknown function (DUF5880)
MSSQAQRTSPRMNMFTTTTTTTRTTTTTTVGLLPTLPGSSGGGGDIARFLHSSGPIVTAVLLKADATVEQLVIDTTPQKQSVQQVLGGPFTFLGQYEEEGIVLMCLRGGGSDDDDDEDHEDDVVDKKKRLPINQHKLQPPFDESQVRGDILCLRVAAQDDDDDDDDDAKDHSNGLHISTQSNEEFFLNYTLEEYMRFAARTDVKAPNVLVSGEDAEDEDDEDHATGSEEEEEDDDEMEGESDDDDDEEGPEGFIEMLMGQVIHRFQSEHGRLPDDTELQALQAAIAQKTGGLLS